MRKQGLHHRAALGLCGGLALAAGGWPLRSARADDVRGVAIVQQGPARLTARCGADAGAVYVDIFAPDKESVLGGAGAPWDAAGDVDEVPYQWKNWCLRLTDSLDGSWLGGREGNRGCSASSVAHVGAAAGLINAEAYSPSARTGTEAVQACLSSILSLLPDAKPNTAAGNLAHFLRATLPPPAEGAEAP